MARRRLTADQTEAVRALYVQWSLSANPVLQSAGAQLRTAGGFKLTDEERAQEGEPFARPTPGSPESGASDG